MCHNTTLDVLFENKIFFFGETTGNIHSEQWTIMKAWTHKKCLICKDASASLDFFVVLSASVRACVSKTNTMHGWAKQHSYGCNIMHSASSCLQMCSFIAISKRLWLSWLLICPSYTEWLSRPFNSGHQAAEYISSSSEEWKQIWLCGTIFH